MPRCCHSPNPITLQPGEFQACDSQVVLGVIVSGVSTMNERKTEDFVERRLRKCGYYLLYSNLTVEKQQNDNTRIRKLLENASKHGERAGKPEFIIRSSTIPDFIVVIECKADPKKHISATRDKYAEYAVDG